VDWEAVIRVGCHHHHGIPFRNGIKYEGHCPVLCVDVCFLCRELDTLLTEMHVVSLYYNPFRQ
jgi:hypothetical protein